MQSVYSGRSGPLSTQSSFGSNGTLSTGLLSDRSSNFAEDMPPPPPLNRVVQAELNANIRLIYNLKNQPPNKINQQKIIDLELRNATLRKYRFSAVPPPPAVIGTF